MTKPAAIQQRIRASHMLISIAMSTASSPPPLPPGLQYGNQFYAVVQELRTFNVSQTDAEQRCSLLTTGTNSIRATVESVAFSLVDATPCASFPSATV
eukprot:1976803-Prymnesium_polylepis.1